MFQGRRKSDDWTLLYCSSLSCRGTTWHSVAGITCSCMKCGVVKVSSRWYNLPERKGKDDSQNEVVL
jgi:hypothetical protein